MKRWLAIGLRMLADRIDPPPLKSVIYTPEGAWTSHGDSPLFAEPELDPTLRGGR